MKEISVLFLDDEQNVLNSISRMFADEAYGVTVAVTPEQAMDILSREKIKVVLSDQRMPGITGIEFLNQVKTKYPDIVRILFTAYADLDATEAAINISEVYRFINKPWHPQELKTSVVGAIHFYDMVMENRRLFEETKTRNEELSEANSKLKEFSSTLSHELRTPLASIKTALDIVLSGNAGKVGEEQRNFLSKAKSNVDRLGRLINNILDLAQMESGKSTLNKEKQDINKVIRSVVETQETVARAKKIYLTMSLDPRIPEFFFDGDKIIQVLNNFINNAIKFTSEGGITVSSHTDIGKLQAEIRISDTGCGISDEDVCKLFEKFRQLGEAHQRHEGTGLGLAIAKEIIRQHDGKVGVTSHKGKGSCFYFIIPIVPLKGQAYDSQ